MSKSISSISFVTTALTIKSSTTLPSLSFSIKVNYHDGTSATFANTAFPCTFIYYTSNKCDVEASSTWYKNQGTSVYVKCTINAYSGSNVRFMTTNYMIVNVESTQVTCEKLEFPVQNTVSKLITNNVTVICNDFYGNAHMSDNSMYTVYPTSLQEFDVYESIKFTYDYDIGYSYENGFRKFDGPEFGLIGRFNSIGGSDKIKPNRVYWLRWPGGFLGQKYNTDKSIECPASDNVFAITTKSSNSSSGWAWVTSSTNV